MSEYSTSHDATPPRLTFSEHSTPHSTPRWSYTLKSSTSESSTPSHPTPEHQIYPSTTATPTSRQSISTATPTRLVSLPSTPITIYHGLLFRTGMRGSLTSGFFRRLSAYWKAFFVSLGGPYGSCGTALYLILLLLPARRSLMINKTERWSIEGELANLFDEYIEVLQPEMLERELGLHDVGILSIKLSGKWMAKPPDAHPIKERDDGVLVFCNAEGELEIHVKRDGCCGDLVNDLTDLWYGLEKEKADWIVCVTPVHQQEYIKTCIKVYNLENDRLADYTFNYQEMLNAEGNMFVYLLNTRARIRLFTKDSCEDIDKLTKASGLELGEGEIWKEGVERVLVQHLLRFTKVIEDSCLPVLPHILCEFLYDLSKNFNCFCDESSVCEVGSVAEKTKLLLCEATRLVMEKSFQLLGITPESSSLREGSPQALSSLLLTERLNHIDPTFKTGKMCGQILISDTYNILLVSDGWGPTSVPDHGFVSLFDIDWHDSVDITNHKAVDLHNPGSRKLVPFSSLMEVRVELYASTKENDALFELSDCLFDIGCEEFLEEEDDARRCMSSSISDDGLVRMYYSLLKDAIDSTIKVTYLPKDDGSDELYGEIFAHYGSEFFWRRHGSC
nr:arginine--tRNA ligase, chloroplastic/mitochondrial [Tanacetum cinerariifolium]